MSIQGPFVLLKLVDREFHHLPYVVYVLPELDGVDYYRLRLVDGKDSEDLVGDDVGSDVKEAFLLISSYVSDLDGEACVTFGLSDAFGKRCDEAYGKWESYKRDTLHVVNEECGGTIKAIFTYDTGVSKC
jgi:hypothetical protein